MTSWLMMMTGWAALIAGLVLMCGVARRQTRAHVQKLARRYRRAVAPSYHGTPMPTASYRQAQQPVASHRADPGAWL